MNVAHACAVPTSTDYHLTNGQVLYREEVQMTPTLAGETPPPQEYNLLETYTAFEFLSLELFSVAVWFICYSLLLYALYFMFKNWFVFEGKKTFYLPLFLGLSSLLLSWIYIFNSVGSCGSDSYTSSNLLIAAILSSVEFLPAAYLFVLSLYLITRFIGRKRG